MSDYLLDVANHTKHRSLLGIFCATCEVNFADEAEHKRHYKSDFHLFNLKRRMLQMLPISEAAFEKSLKEVMERSKAAPRPEGGGKTCEVCWKDFKSVQTYNEHLKSKKHLESQKNPRKKPETKEVVRTAKDDLRVCLFCNAPADTLELNLAHMEQTHGFFLCEAEFLVDREGLLKELAEQIFDDNMCLYCQYVKKRDWGSWRAVQMHMLEAGHCLMNPDFLSVFSQFYDYSDALAKAKEKYGELRAQKEEVTAAGAAKTSGEEEAGEDGWVDIEDEDELPEDKKKGREAGKGKMEAKRVTRSEWKQFIQKQFTKNELGELVLPDNRVLGIRAFQRYYNQPANGSPFQREYYLRALRNKVGEQETALMVHMDVHELRQHYQLKVLKEENELRLFCLREMRALNLKNEVWRRQLNRVRTKKDRRHNYTLNRYRVDRNMCTF